MRSTAVTALAVLACLALARAVTFDHVVSAVANFQDANGGFRAAHTDDLPTVDATASGLFLSSLYGLKNEIKNIEVSQFLQSLENTDFGFARMAGGPSTLKDTRQALLAYEILGVAVPNPANVVSYVRTLYDAKSSKFANRVGEAGSLRATAHAFQSLEFLQELSRSYVTDLAGGVKSFLSSKLKGDHFVFEGENLSTVTANYYGIVLAKLLKLDINKEKFADYILALQDKDASSVTFGGFSSGSDKTVNLDSTVHAVLALHELSAAAAQKVDEHALVKFVRSLRHDIVSAAAAHRVVALTKAVNGLFHTEVTYDAVNSVPPKDRFIQGTDIKPVVAITSFDHASHTGLEVTADVKFPGKAAQKVKLAYSAEQDAYVSADYLDTKGQLGEATFEYHIRGFVVGVGEIAWSVKDAKNVGYGLNIDAKASFAGKAIRAGDHVGTGTAFEFALQLYTQQEQNLQSGAFKVTFDVLDSSDVSIHSETINGKGNAKPIGFAYTLKANNVPAGTLTFRFSVADESSAKAHTVSSVHYGYGVPMVASKITFKDGGAASYKLLDTVVVTMEPGNFPDLRTVHPYDFSAERHFEMVIATPSGNVVARVAGVGAKSGYTFTHKIDNTLASIGTNHISFRYVQKHGEPIAVDNYDSKTGELWDDAAMLGFTVQAELYMTDIKEQPKDNSFHYGNTINYRFNVKDAVSGHAVHAGDETQDANVYLVLKHQGSNKKLFTSTRQAATPVKDDGFAISWTINPNAIGGPGVLEIAGYNADGQVVAVAKEKGKKDTMSTNINIGGEIAVQSEVYSTKTLDTLESVFVAEFQLSCKNKLLKEAQLRCTVLHKTGDATEELSRVPVAVTPSADSYQVSWVAPHRVAKAGTYVLQFHREVDRARAAESKAAAEKKRAKDQLLGGKEDKAEADELELAPLFEIKIEHEEPYDPRPTISTHTIVLLGLLGAVAFGYVQKGKLE